jgi:hypothetical protein
MVPTVQRTQSQRLPLLVPWPSRYPHSGIVKQRASAILGLLIVIALSHGNGRARNGGGCAAGSKGYVRPDSRDLSRTCTVDLPGKPVDIRASDSEGCEGVSLSARR